MADRPGAPRPYVGPRPFERQHQNLFFGRDREANDILSLAIAHRLLLVYAPSGAGKTSLINAGVIPLLEQEGFEVLPLARVRGRIPSDIVPEEVYNLYAFNVLVSWLGDEADPRMLLGMSIGDFLEERERPIDDLGMPAPRAIILDQFEELLIFYPQRWPDREGLFRQLGDALDRDPLLRVLLVLREDYIAQLDPYTPLLPGRLGNRLRVERLRRDAALAAVKGPLVGSGRAFTEGVAEQLVEELLQIRVEGASGEAMLTVGEFVEPVQLQVVCQSLWQDLPPEVEVITPEHLRAFGDADQALSRFYERSIAQAAGASGASEQMLRSWFEESLITPAGTRGTVYRGPEETGGIPNAAVDVLEDMHLIRGEWRAGARWYELVHDRFIEPIQMSNDAWRARHKGLMAQLTALMAPLIVRMPRLSPPQTLTIRRLSCLVWALALLSALAIIAAVLGWMR